MMKFYARIDNNVLVELIPPSVYGAESPDWQEGDSSRIGDEIPIEERYPPIFISWLVDITGVDPIPQQGWLWDGSVFTPPQIGPTLPQAKESKAIELRQNCDDEIERTSFTSSALGAVHNYDCRVVDQININIRYAVASHLANSQPLWASDGTRYAWVDHTAGEIIGVLVDMNEHIKENQVILVTKLAAVDAATTVAQVLATSW